MEGAALIPSPPPLRSTKTSSRVARSRGGHVSARTEGEWAFGEATLQLSELIQISRAQDQLGS